MIDMRDLAEQKGLHFVETTSEIYKMTVNYYYNSSTLTERVELTNVEAFVRGVRRYLTEVTFEGKWFYSKDGMDIPYKEFKARLSKFM